MDSTKQSTESYQQKRRAFFQQYPSFWSDLKTEYALYHVYPLPQQTIAQLKQAAQRLGHIFTKTATLLRAASTETLLDLGVPANILPYLRLKHPALAETIIGRFDFALTKQGPKLLEFNSDTPTFIYETFFMNGQLCEHFQQEDPNHGDALQLGQALENAISTLITTIDSPNQRPVVRFTSFAWHQEDRGTTEYLMSLVKLTNLDIAYVPLEALTVDDQGVYDQKGTRIDILYRLYPIEHVVEDKDPSTGEKIGLKLLQLVKEQKLALLNPLSAFLLQSKAVQVVIWGLHEQTHPFFSSEEQHWIAEYMLPTYLEPNGMSHFVRKPVLGREGDSITIVKQGTTQASKERHYADQLYVYQEYVPLPSVCLLTETGSKQMQLLSTCFLITGQALGVGLRAAETEITDNTSYFLAVGLESSEKRSNPT